MSDYSTQSGIPIIRTVNPSPLTAPRRQSAVIPSRRRTASALPSGSGQINTTVNTSVDEFVPAPPAVAHQTNQEQLLDMQSQLDQLRRAVYVTGGCGGGGSNVNHGRDGEMSVSIEWSILVGECDN